MRVAQEHVTHPDRAYRYERFELAAFAAPRHRHPQLELTWIERGAGVRHVGDSAVPFASGDLVLLGADVPHTWLGTHFDGAATGLATVLQFPPTLLAQPLLPELAALRPLAEQARRGLVISGATHARVTQLLAALREADALARLAGLLTVLRELALHPADLQPIASSLPRPTADGARERRIDRVTDWVHRHLSGPLGVTEAAQVAHVSPAAFSRFFRRETGKTWSTYINDVRCSEASVMLRQTGEPVARVAEACGYLTLSHFNREFRARFGVAPRMHRRATPAPESQGTLKRRPRTTPPDGRA